MSKKEDGKKVVDEIKSRIPKQCTSESVINDQPRLNKMSEGFTMANIVLSEFRKQISEFRKQISDYETAIDEIYERIPKNLQGKTGGHGRKSKNRRNKIVFKKRRTRRRRRKF